MKKLIIFVLLVVLIDFGWSYYRVAKTDIWLGYPKVEQMTYVPWEYIRSGMFARQLKMMYEEGKLEPKFSPNVIPMEGFAQSKSEDIDKFGVGFMTYRPSQLSMSTTDEVEPFNYPGTFRTRLGRQEYIVLPQQWITKDQKISYIMYLVPPRLTEKNGPDKYLFGITNSVGVPSMMPLVRYKDNAACEKLTKEDKTYCAWYMGMARQIKSALDKWEKSGEVPEEIGRYPMWMSIAI